MVLQRRNSPPSGMTIACSFCANTISSSTFLVVWETTATLRGRRGDTLAPGAARRVPGQVSDLLGRDRFRCAGPPDHAAHLGVVGVAVDDQEIALAHQLLRQPLHLGDQWAGRVDQLDPGGRGFAREMRTHAVGGDRHAPEPAVGGLGDRRRALDAALTQALDDLRIVDDVADRGDRAGALGRGFDDLEGAPNPQQ